MLVAAPHTFATSLAPRLEHFFNFLQAGQSLNVDLNSAYISVIPKPSKDAGEVENYRPISLLNNDLKLLTKIQANRLASFINNYVHIDQVGFIPGRLGPDQIRRAVDIISVLQLGWSGDPHQEGMLLSIDLEKAFDSVSWSYMFELLGTWGFSE